MLTTSPIANFLQCSQFLHPAAMADAVMTAYHPAAFRTFPFFFFPGQELYHTVFFHIIQVLNHAHMIVLYIAFIKRLEIITGELITFETITNLPVFQ